MFRLKGCVCAASAVTALLAYFVIEPEAHAVPSFARKYQTSCETCHTIYPMLNPFGEAFRRNGYRFPSENGSVDSDAVKAPTIAMGQEEYKSTFPHSVWPSSIVESIPLGIMVNGAVTMNFPDSDAKAAAGNVFAWNGILAEGHIFAAGSFSDTLTYFAQLTFSKDGVDPETGYLLWNDILGPRHLFNIWVGRLMAPQLTSWGLHSSYLSDTWMSPVSIAGLYNPTGTFTLGQGHNDGIEINGIVRHRWSYALGFVSSLSALNNKQPNSEDVYARLSYKRGGMTLDGEGRSGAASANAKKPWSEISLTLDFFAYHGITLHDNGTGTIAPTPLTPAITPNPIGQNNSVNTLGGAGRLQLGSLNINAGLTVQKHSAPYPGVPPTPANPPSQPNALPGVPNYTEATGITEYNEINYVVFPWLVPGVRTEFTHIDLSDPSTCGTPVGCGGGASLLRIIPGIALAIRPNVRLILTGGFEYAHGMPPVGSWGAAGGSIVAAPHSDSKLEAETLTGTLAWAL